MHSAGQASRAEADPTSRVLRDQARWEEDDRGSVSGTQILRGLHREGQLGHGGAGKSTGLRGRGATARSPSSAGHGDTREKLLGLSQK